MCGQRREESNLCRFKERDFYLGPSEDIAREQSSKKPWHSALNVGE